MHAAALAMHRPAQIFCMAGHWAPHFTPSQVALPPVGAGQAVHEAPQVAGSASLTQAPLQG